MQTFENCCQEYHVIFAAALGHFSSDMAVEVRNKEMAPDLNLYLDLDNWPDNPELLDLTEAQKQRLREWGPDYMQKLQAFHDKTEELKQAVHQTVCEALKVLGEEMGREFLTQTSGPFDERIATVLSRADLLRKTLLDGFGYVDVLDPESNFAKGFFKVTKLNKTKLFSDLKLCAQIRENGTLHSFEIMKQLGFHQE